MKYRIVLSAAFAILAGVLLSAVADTPQEKYIREYAPVAVREMYRSGVPASITLAQGLLESRYGQSDLAVNGNNHFGIKCHDWTGRKMYHDDDLKGECFRVYKSADESFSDHSDFLRYRDRYKPLFDNDVTDYKAWAHGLKKAGYATDPSYPSKLIKLIEEYHLYDYDRMSPEDFGQKPSAAHESGHKKEEKAAEVRNPEDIVMPSALTRKQKREERKRGTRRESAPVTVRIPESPHALEEPVKVSAPSEVFTVALSRKLYSNNGVEFVYSSEGEKYSDIAHDFNLFLREILRFNDAVSDAVLAPGTMVYVQQKKNQAPKGLDKYISDEGGESMRDVAQRFGVKLSDLCKLNSLSSGHVLAPGDEIRLRK